MELKIGDKVRFKTSRQEGTGTIVAVQYVKNQPFLVNSDDIVNGHDGGNVNNDRHRQENKNNWWFYESELTLVEQDLRELLKVGYKVEFLDGSFLINGDDDFAIKTSDFNKDLHWKHGDVRVDKIYRPKYNGIKTIKNPEWELVWERPKEKLYQLVFPKGMYHHERLLAKLDGVYFDLSITKKKHQNKIKYCKYQFTQEEIDRITFDTSFFTKKEINDEN